jgi:hypothetical protein
MDWADAMICGVDGDIGRMPIVPDEYYKISIGLIGERAEHTLAIMISCLSAHRKQGSLPALDVSETTLQFPRLS